LKYGLVELQDRQEACPAQRQLEKRIEMREAEMTGNVAVTVRVQPMDDNVTPEPSAGFVTTQHVQELTDRAMAYLDVGYAIHFAGPAGTGKSTLAYHVAAMRGRPVTLIHGDDEFGSSDLVGRDTGYRKSRIVDNYIHSVLKTQENLDTVWVDNRLTTACQNGYTLIYDEFNRSRPEANNALLSVLEERVLNLPGLRRSGAGYLEVHPEFRAIFTSNPEEYAGVHKTQDALMDRMITVRIAGLDRETEVEVTMARSGVGRADAENVVDIVRALREVRAGAHRPTIRASIAMARILARREAHAHLEDPVFQWVCRDVLYSDTARVTRDGQASQLTEVEEIMAKVCGPAGKRLKNRIRIKEEALCQS
jgi:nitric oxide reductase NorQ protein